MSALKQVLKNIYTYFDILQTASEIDVAGWTKDDVENAFQWAKYCEEVKPGYFICFHKKPLITRH